METATSSPSEPLADLTDSRTVFRAMLAHDFKLAGSFVLFPGGVRASVELALRSMAEQAGSLEARQVQLERLLATLARTIHGFERYRRELELASGSSDLPELPRFDRWWDAMKAAHGF